MIGEIFKYSFPKTFSLMAYQCYDLYTISWGQVNANSVVAVWCARKTYTL